MSDFYFHTFSSVANGGEFLSFLTGCDIYKLLNCSQALLSSVDLCKLEFRLFETPDLNRSDYEAAQAYRETLGRHPRGALRKWGMMDSKQFILRLFLIIESNIRPFCYFCKAECFAGNKILQLFPKYQYILRNVPVFSRTFPDPNLCRLHFPVSLPLGIIANDVFGMYRFKLYPSICSGCIDRYGFVSVRSFCEVTGTNERAIYQALHYNVYTNYFDTSDFVIKVNGVLYAPRKLLAEMGSKCKPKKFNTLRSL